MVDMKKRGRGKCEWQGRVPMQMRFPTTITNWTKVASSHPSSLFKFLLPTEFALANRVRDLAARGIEESNQLHFSSFHELMNRAKNVDKEHFRSGIGGGHQEITKRSLKN